MRSSLVLLLLGGAASAHAQPASASASAQQLPVLTSFTINDGAAVAPSTAPLRLSHTVVGAAPSVFRVSTRADFLGADWLPYLRRPELPLSAFATAPGCDAPGSTRRIRLFFQVRSLHGQEMRIVNGLRTLVPLMAESNVMADSICIGDPARL